MAFGAFLARETRHVSRKMQHSVQWLWTFAKPIPFENMVHKTAQNFNVIPW